MTTNLMQASNQWLYRPIEETFPTMAAMTKAATEYKLNATEARKVNMTLLKADYNADQIELISPTGTKAFLNHYSTQQLCGQLKIPADYLRRLSGELASKCLTYGLATEGRDDANVLFRRGENGLQIRAVTSDQYDRVWNADICGRVADLQGLGWQVPPCRPKPNTPEHLVRIATKKEVLACAHKSLGIKEGDRIGPGGLYLSDRDMFCFFVDPSRPIVIGGTVLYRGFFVENSEVGDGAFKITFFIFNAVCGNLIIWDVREVKEVKVIHRGNRAEERAFRSMEVEVKTYMNASGQDDVLKIQKAQRLMLPGADKLEVVDFLFGKKIATKEQLNAAYDMAEKHPEDRGGAAITSAWGMAQGLTRVSQDAAYTRQRVDIDKGASKIIQMAF